MKRLFTTFFLLALVCVSAWAQAPQKMSYQAVVRDANNSLVANQNVSARISILQGSATGSAVYTETQTVATNANGLMTLSIGEGTVVSGNFGSIDWANGPYFLKSEIDPNGGISYTIESVQQLMSVPYALYAATSGNGEGPQGPVGPQGPQGDTGAAGPQGPAGQDGVSPTVATTTTPTGTFVVITDASGSHQFFVANGADGAAGAQGPQGIQGATGPQGPAGADGTNGTNGADGRGILNIIGPISNGLIDTYTITYTDGTTSTFTVTNGAAGTNGTNGADGRGILNIIGPVSNGLIDTYTITYTDGTTSTFTVTNGAVGAQGPAGTNGTDGADGRGILSISNPVTNGLTDTYTITYTDGTTSTFTVTNGATGAQGPAGTNGTNGTDGRGILSISNPVTNGLTDTYTITYTDGTTSTFTVTNGAVGAQGPAGTNGTNGQDGFSPVVTTTAAGDSTMVTITDANGPHTFVLHNGQQGLQGPQGPAGSNGTNGTDGFSPVVTTTAAGDSTVVTITDANGSHSFVLHNGQQGETGPQGPIGPAGSNGTNGTDGQDGFSPTVTTTAAGDSTVVTITDANGPHTFVLHNGQQGPQGPQGETGLTGTNGTDGRGIAYIAGPVSAGHVDTYTINYTDGTTSTFTVTNGLDGTAAAAGIGIDSIAKTGTEGLVDTYTITYTDGTTSTFTVTNGAAGVQGPVGPQGVQGETGATGATGPQGPAGTNGTNGADGRGIQSISGPVTNGLTDTYTINYTDGTTSTFTLTNGAVGAQGPVGPQGAQGETGATGPQGPAGANGTNGADGRGIQSISGPVTNGLTDTYTINYTDGTTSTFTVTNGAAGAQGPEGPQGPAGSNGTNGTNGQDGFSPVVTTTAAGDSTVVTITDANGPHTFVLHNGQQGPQGPQGPAGLAGSNGTNGTDGHDGFSPTVTTTAAGDSTVVTITDATGPHTFVVYNGQQGSVGATGPMGSQGPAGETGNGIQSITKTGTNGNVDTYTITFTNGDTYNFEVTNGADCTGADLSAINNSIAALNQRIDSLNNVIDNMRLSMTLGRPCSDVPTVVDVDGNIYNTVKIGAQCWMKENLRTTRKPDGTDIPLNSILGRFYPNEDSNKVASYGYLYTWTALMNGANSSTANPSGVQGICPDGWHVPSRAEWKEMTDYLSSLDIFYCNNNLNNIAKVLASTYNWISSTNTCAVGNSPDNNNLTGFTAVPSGSYIGGNYYDFGSSAFIWTATQHDSNTAWHPYLNSSNSAIYTNRSLKRVGLSVRCLHDNTYSGNGTDTAQIEPTASLPTVTTAAVSQITQTTATCGGNVILDGGATVTARGVCWNTSPNPTISESHTTDGSGTGSFSSNMTGLNSGTTYYVRAYATNSEGTVYGNEVSFTTISSGTPQDGQPCPSTPTITDHEGNVYNTVQIGNQCWMRENLRTTTSPSTGTYLIPAVGTGNTYTGKQARWYNNDSTTYAPMKYGLLYNWNAAADTFNTAYGETSVNTDFSNAVSVTFNGHRRGICPEGWHLPSDAEWTAMTDYVRGQSEYLCNSNTNYIAKALADSVGWVGWTSNTCAVLNNPSANNTTGFSAVPAGNCNGSSFNNAGNNANFWCATQDGSSLAFYRGLTYHYAYAYRDYYFKDTGYSVRCLRD